MVLWFGEVHIFTLVISSSLVGIIDYGIHFLTERRLHGQQESPHQTRARPLPSLSMALFATLVGYGLLWLAPSRLAADGALRPGGADGLVHYRALPVPVLAR